jgi:tetratricopeptide (TPR) repeat protein
MSRKHHRAPGLQGKQMMAAQQSAAQSAFASALQHHRAGRLHEAEHLYRQVLSGIPRHGGTLHLLGVIASQTGRHDLAVELIRKAIKIEAKVASYHANLGNALQAKGLPDEAVGCYRRALALDPGFAEAHNNLGNVFAASRRLNEAIGCYRKALDLRPDDAEAQYNLGNALRAHGDLADAVSCYRRAIELRPNYLKAHHNLGGALKDLGQLDEAMTCCRRVIALAPEFAEAHFNLGNVLIEKGLIDEAIACQRRAIALDPNYAEAYSNLGAALAEQGQQDDAVAACRRAIALRADFPKAHTNLGNAYEALGRTEEAVACYRRALELQPEDAEACSNLGNALVTQGLLADAVGCFRRALSLRPDFVDAHYNLGNALRDQEKIDEAIASYRRALTLQPDLTKAYTNLGGVLMDWGQLDDAVACYRKAVELRPDHPDTYNNLGVTLGMQRRFDEAEACYRKALALWPDHAGAHNNVAMVLLARGELTAGWQENEWRWETPTMLGSRRAFAQPQWRGEVAEGQTLLIHAEQGFGDTLQFCRYASLAAARGLFVVMEVQRPLVRLMRGLPGVKLVVAQGEDLPPFDVHCPLLSMPAALGTTVATIPASPSYLYAEAAQVAAWQTRLDTVDDKRPRVGLIWAGSARPVAALAAIDRRRSLPPQRFAPLVAVPGLRFFSLQKGGPAAPADFALTDFMDEMNDFADTAALIANLDLVISVDTAVAHLSAALGKPVWLLDRFDADWRWLTGRTDSPWYPTLRIFRQPQFADWDTVLAEAAGELGRLASGYGAAIQPGPMRLASVTNAAVSGVRGSRWG